MGELEGVMVQCWQKLLGEAGQSKYQGPLAEVAPEVGWLLEASVGRMAPADVHHSLSLLTMGELEDVVQCWGKLLVLLEVGQLLEVLVGGTMLAVDANHAG
jgi:hypothetical protein